jgi:hypothetical protein
MKNFLTILSTATMFFIGCNDEANKNDKTTQEQPKVEALSELEALDDQLPEAAIMRVELDAAGNVIPGTEDLRTVSKLSEASIVESFDASEAPKAGSAELDQDSSTQSWFMTQVEDGKQTNPNQTSQQYPNQGQANQNQANQTNQSSYPSSGYPSQDQGNQSQTPCYNCPDQTVSNCNSCNNTVEHRQGPSTSAYPVSNKTIYEHRTRDIYPQQQVDIYPIEKVRIHPTQVTTRVHPVQRQIEYVGNQCQQNNSACSYGSQYYPTVSYGSYNQYYHYQSYQNFGGYRYYRYCRPRIFARLFGW